MKQITDGVWLLRGQLPIPYAINTYLVGDVLIDAGAKGDKKQILKQLGGRELSAHALTHAHADHQGASKAVCEKFGVPFWVGANDADAAENPQLILERQPDALINRIFFKRFAGPGHKVDRKLAEGDEVAGFKVIDAPGHSAGHVAYFREADRVLILGDVLNSMEVFTGLRGLREPKTFFTPDPSENRRSIHKLAALEPETILFGHGPPVTDAGKFQAFCAQVPAS